MQVQLASDGHTKTAAEIVDLVLNSKPLSCVASTHLLSKYLREKCGLVEPVEVPLGIIYKGDGHKNLIVDKTVYAQVIPLEKSLTQLLSIKELKDFVIHPPSKTDDKYFENIRDGSVYKNHELCNKYPDALLLQLYEDDVEVVNPLGSHVKVHKLLNMYYSILNFPESVRSNLKSISLVSLAKSQHVKEFGREACLTDFFEVVAKLESNEGLQLQINGEQIVFHGTLLCVVGDNLSMNQLGGFKGGFSWARRPCRTCMCSQEEIKIKLCEFDMVMRTKTEHNNQLNILAQPHNTQIDRDAKSVEFGVNEESILNKLPYFDITKMLPPDAMHNLLEGVCDVEMKSLLNYLVNELKVLTCEQLNFLVDSFPYPHELSKNKPSLIEKQHIGPDGQLRQSASQSSVLLVVLPIILARFVDSSDQRYLNFILLTQISQVLLAYRVKKSSISELQRMIYEHHIQFQKLYPHVSFTPKFHFLTHAPSVIEMFGATRNAWCMRFEARHAWFARVAARANNFKNIAKTLATRFQLRHALDLGLSDEKATVLNEKSFLAADLKNIAKTSVPLGQEISDLLNHGPDDLICCAGQVFIQNIELRQGLILLIADPDDGLPLFGLLTALFVKDQTCCVATQMLETKYFDFMKNAYVVEKTSKFCCVKTDQLPCIQTFPKICYRNEMLVNLMHYDRTEFIG